ncbi:isocitrate/isopropylmalate family dehydrogenase [Solirhodobacter olei]|uniref:isocitrate/isopropylmalate family dehydrogenase n=1 Tax=Solirhodobacter olei TaxID=2493082 RepID=UPI0013E2F6DC|nr:isocitrate/isopropylmalate family dehydrogenase [Solirhodobacter olei]
MLDRRAISTGLAAPNVEATPAVIPVALISGAGVGPELARAARTVINAVCPGIDWIEAEMDGAELPSEALDAIATAGVVLKAPMGPPLGGFGDGVGRTLVQTFELYGNVRRIRTLPGVPGPYPGRDIDLTIVRDTEEGLVGALEKMHSPDVAQGVNLVTRQGAERIARLAIGLARNEGRKRIICAHRSDTLKLTEGLFLRAFESVAAEHPEIGAHDILADNCARQLVLHPEQFEMVLASGTSGDVLADLATGLAGGLAFVPSAYLGRDVAMFEVLQGCSPRLAGRDRANPTAMILAAAMMLRHLGIAGAAARVEAAVRRAYARHNTLRSDAVQSGDVISAMAFVEGIVAELDAVPPITPEPALRTITHNPQLRRRSPRGELIRVFEGVDICVEWHGTPGALAERIHAMDTGNFRLSMISSRGKAIWPARSATAETGTHWSCRFVATAGEPLEHELPKLLVALGEQLRWTHVEKLEAYNGFPAYARSQAAARLPIPGRSN